MEGKREKNIALKASTIDDDDEREASKEDDLALITRKIKKFIKFDKNKWKKFHLRKDSQKKEPSNVDKKKKDLKWYKCKKIGHIKYDYPLYKNEVKRGKKKVMMVTWSESEE